MVLTPLVTLSVNHAKVVPTSMTRHITSAITLVSSARLLVFLVVISFMTPRS